jgi:hypothetical protein
MSIHTQPLNPCPPNQFDLLLPPNLTDQLSPEKLAKITRIQVRFARGVASLIAKNYAEVLAVLGEEGHEPVEER